MLSTYRPFRLLTVLQRLRSLLLPLSLLCWLLLLLSSLSLAGAAAWLGNWPSWSTLLAQAAFAAFTFLYCRYQPERLRGHDFVGLLRRLVLGPGLLALVCVGLHLLAQQAAGYSPRSQTLIYTCSYTINLGLFVFFLAQTQYAWRSLASFKASPGLRREWDWFEILLGLTLLFCLIDWPVLQPVALFIAGGLALFGMYLSSRQRWVAYLIPRQKWQAIIYQLALLTLLLLFVQYFRVVATESQLLTPTPQHVFLLLASFFAAFYALMGLLVTFFNLPTANVFEQRRNEIVRLQRLNHIIQQGQTAAEIYRTLLDSAIQTVEADAALLSVLIDPPAADAGPAMHAHQLSVGQAQTLSQAMQTVQMHDMDYLNNNLKGTPAFSALREQLPCCSLLALPMRGSQGLHGTLYLLKNEENGFDHEDLNLLNTFTSQAVLSVENLHLAQAALANQRTQEELKIASQVQDSLIPKKLPTDDWFEISSHSLPAKEVGGDFYDFLLLPGRRLAVLIGDVSGKGVTAAFHMAQMKGIFHALMQENPLAKSDRDRFPLPSRFMIQANTALAHCLERSSFITSSLYIIDYEQGGFMFARAGHCHTLYYHAAREEVFYFQSSGLGLGIIRNEGYEKHISNQFYDYGAGDVMIIYTDGIVEARGEGQAEYGEDRLKQRLEEAYFMDAEDIKNNILDDLNRFTTGQPIHDDQTLLVIKFKMAQPNPLA